MGGEGDKDAVCIDGAHSQVTLGLPAVKWDFEW
jgi:hypothetical protein